MKYRVRFRLEKQYNGFWYTEWFDTLDEAKDFVGVSEALGGVHPLAIENEDGDPQ